MAPAPVTTPRKPVKQVMAPKMRLWGQKTVECDLSKAKVETEASVPWDQALPVFGPTGRAVARLCCLLYNLSTVKIQGNPHAQGPCSEGHSGCGQGGEDVTAAGENPGRETELVQQAALTPGPRRQPLPLQPATYSHPRQKCSFSGPAEGSGYRNNNLRPKCHSALQAV